MTAHLFLSTMTSRPCISSKEHAFLNKSQPAKHFGRLFTFFSYVLQSQSRVCVRLCAMLLRQLEPVRYRIGMHVCILIFETYHTCLPIAFVQECKVSDVLNPIVHVVPSKSAKPVTQCFAYQITHVFLIARRSSIKSDKAGCACFQACMPLSQRKLIPVTHCLLMTRTSSNKNRSP